MAERLIEEYCRAHGMRAVSLRYFNAAGADAGGEVGEAHEPETHLIPNLIRAAIDPSAGPVKVYGNDYETADGTCIRDYIHVDDLCEAHSLALDCLSRSGGFRALNLGSGHGYSVAEVLAACRAQCNGMPEAEFVERRPGDPPCLVASSAAAALALGWKPSRGLTDCVATALSWHRGSSP
jgi:UDP-glucose 4-epimerase